MNALDILILAVVLVGFVKGLMCGFFRQVVSIVGFLAGLWVAFMLYSVLGDWIAPYIGSDVSVGRALAFILLWIGVPVGLSLLAYMLTKAVETVKLGGLNRLGGALLGGRTVSGHIGSRGFARSGAGGPQTGESGKEHRGHRPGQRHEISVYADVPAEMIKTR